MKFNHLKAINEVYFGNSTELEQIIEQLHKIRQLYFDEFEKSTFKLNKYYTKINTSPELTELNRMFEDFFGFKTFAIHIQQSKINNACTIPISSKFDTPIIKDKHIISTKTGFKYKKEYEFSSMLYISSGLLANKNVTDREILAIMFHEIGHNFAAASSIGLCILDTAKKPFMIFSMLVGIFTSLFDKGMLLFGTSNKLTEVYNDCTKKIKSNHPEIVNSINYLYGTRGLFNEIIIEIQAFLSYCTVISGPIVSNIQIILSALINKFMGFIYSPISLLNFIFGREHERFSDNFTSLYGLGPDLASALGKITDKNGLFVNEIINNDPFCGTLYNIFIMPALFVVHLLDEHPETAARMYQQVKYVERELNKSNIDPKLKSQLEKDLKDLNNIINKYLYENENAGLKLRRLISGFFYEMSGGDVRDLFNHDNKNTSKNIDKLYDKTKIESANIFDFELK